MRYPQPWALGIMFWVVIIMLPSSCCIPLGNTGHARQVTLSTSKTLSTRLVTQTRGNYEAFRMDIRSRPGAGVRHHQRHVAGSQLRSAAGMKPREPLSAAAEHRAVKMAPPSAANLVTPSASARYSCPGTILSMPIRSGRPPGLSKAGRRSHHRHPTAGSDLLMATRNHVMRFQLRTVEFGVDIRMRAAYVGRLPLVAIGAQWCWATTPPGFPTTESRQTARSAVTLSISSRPTPAGTRLSGDDRRLPPIVRPAHSSTHARFVRPGAS